MEKDLTLINSLITKLLTDTITSDEKKTLDEWIRLSPQNSQYFDRILNDSNLTDRYQVYKKMHEEEAWKNFKRHCMPKLSIIHTLYKYAAILTIPVVGTILLMLLIQNHNPKPQYSEQARISMIKSQQLGKEKAILILPNGKNLSLQSHIDEPIQTAPVCVQLEKAETQEQLNNNNILITKKENEYWVTFEDGSIVHLNYNTTLRYPAHFSSEDRTVYLNGEAYFQIAKDKKRPFRVVTSNSVIKEYGTSFNVSTRKNNATNVVLIEGSISITPNNGKEYMIKPGEMATVQSDSNITINEVNVEPYVAWNEGHFAFDNYSLKQITDVISQWHGMNIIYTSDDIKDMHFTGDMDRYGSIQPFLRAIQSVTHLNIKVKENNIIISK